MSDPFERYQDVCDKHVDAASLIRAISDMLNWTRMSRLDGYTLAEVMTLCLACLASGHDVYPDQLSDEQCEGILSGKWRVPEFDMYMDPAGGKE